MTPIDTRLTDLVDAERALVAAEFDPSPDADTIRTAHARARQIVEQRRRQRITSVVVVVLAVVAIGATALWATRADDDGSSLTVGLPDPAQVGNPPGPQTGPRAPASAFAHAGQVTPGGPATLDFAPGQPIVRTGFNDRQLVVTIIGGEPRAGDDDPNPCGVDYVGAARLDGDRFVIRLDEVVPTSRPTNVTCSLVGFTRMAVINLPEPLGNRTVVDEAGEPIRVVDASSFLIPRVVPDGWTPRSEAIYAEPSVGERGFQWVQGYSDLDPFGATAAAVPSIRVEEVETAGATTLGVAKGLRIRPGATPDAPLDGRVVDNQGAPLTPVGRATVRGHTALMFDYLGDQHTLTLIWQEGTRVHAITADSTATPGIDLSDLVAMAQSMTTAMGG